MKLPEPINTITNLIDQYHKSQSERPRPHMGCSALGHPCDRWLWLSFRWAVVEEFEGRILRLFRRGQNEEEIIVRDLRNVGIDISSSQARVSFGSHVSGSLDGIIESGVPEAPTKRHVAEFKTHSKKSFDDMVKHGVEKSKWTHYVQMQVYMHGTQIDRALYLAVCKDDDRIYTERVRYEQEVAEKYIERGRRLALEDRMPPPISTDPTWFECKMCAGHDFCNGSKTTKEVNCRTCAHATPLSDSTWHCAKWDDVIPLESQRTGCESHVLHPDLVPWQRKDGPDEFTAVYEINGVNLANGDPEQEGVWGSKELLANAEACASGDPLIAEMRKDFGGRIVG